MSLLSIIGNLAFILIAFSFMVKDMLWLRGLSIIASFCSIFYNYNVAEVILWVPIRWNLFFMSLNIYHVVKIIYGNRNIKLTEKENELYQLAFKNLSLLEFSKLMNISQWKKVEAESIIINENQKMDQLFMIYNGTVDVLISDRVVNELKDGSFIGEMSFLSDGIASATVKTKYPSEFIIWKQEELKELMKRNPSLIYSLQSAMGNQMAKSLKETNIKNSVDK